MFKFTKNITSILLLLSLMLVATGDILPSLTQKIECEITMDCCSVDASQSHSCCCDFEESSSENKNPLSDFSFQNLKLNLSCFASTSLFNFSSFSIAKNEIIHLVNDLPPPQALISIISYIYYNSSLPRIVR